MAKSSLGFSEHQIARRIKDGRGQGLGKEYRPWLYVQDVPSDGRSHRVYSHKTGRIHHLLSDLELAAFLVFEWTPNITDIREQFP
ncbi:MAG: heteromeric transposase endonuclease subunit TnsA, partial [Serratia marcescens]|nr:heteromeric transposase endonuclease subunit TnsA [Serratia marcescens]